ncbi:MAG TPA: anti-sigma factor domain-containing protein [Firmicutes bacterium]|nr:anti-sigma factor domain-containing protein [Candidatus Fermentithermobacillaceae bacterium]
MNRRQAIVLERKGNRMTVMTKSGEFLTLKAAHEGVFPGDVVTLSPPVASQIIFGRLIPALALSVVMIFLSFFGYHEYLMARPAVAYMTFDSYGSIELEINDRNQVTSAVALDQAGVEILKSIDYKFKPVDVVMAELVKAQESKGSTNVVIALVPVDEDREVKHLEDMVVTGVAKEIWAEPAGPGDTDPPPAAPEVSVAMVTLDLAAREEAKKMGISAGRAASWALSHVPAKPQEPGEPRVDPSQEPQGEPSDIIKIWDTIRSKLPEVNLENVIQQEEPEKYLKDVTKKWLKELDNMLKAKEKDKNKDKDKDKDKDKGADDDALKGKDKDKDKDKDKGKDVDKGKDRESVTGKPDRSDDRENTRTKQPSNRGGDVSRFRDPRR